ncbi:MAG: hypothetical protein RBR87_14635 [Bacteroidales bacterium]|jgi:hypothetical protein|nr:hypothetical protein [Bacteroidales bacterium]
MKIFVLFPKAFVPIILVLINLLYVEYNDLLSFATQNSWLESNDQPMFDLAIDSIELEETVFMDDYFSQCDPDCRLFFLNTDCTEKLTLYFYPGRNSNVPSYFKVSLNENSINSFQALEVSRFISSKNVSLGIAKDTLLSYLTYPQSTQIDHETSDTIEFFISRNADYYISQLNKYNYPAYKAKYIFRNNELIEFEMGFIYP